MTAEGEQQSHRGGVLETRPALVLAAVAAALLLIALVDLPIGYYRVLRYAVCIAGVGLVVFDIRRGKLWWTLLAIPLVVIWAPGASWPFVRFVWQILDVLAAAAFLTAGALIPAPVEKEGRSPWKWWVVTLTIALIGAFVAYGPLTSSDDGRDCSTVHDNRGSYCE